MQVEKLLTVMKIVIYINLSGKLATSLNKI